MASFFSFSLIFTGIMLTAASARADKGEARKVRLEYILGKGTETCADEEVLRHVIRTHTADNPFSATAKVLLRVSIGRAGNGFQSSYVLVDDSGKVLMERSLPVHRTCEFAMEAVGFSVGMFVPPLLTEKVALKPPSPAPPPPPPSPAPPPPPPPHGLPITGRLDLGALATFGTLTNAAFGFSGHIGGRWSFVSLSVGGRAEFSTRNGTDTFHASTWRVVAEAVPCLHLGQIAFGCGVLQTGRLIFTLQTPWHLYIENLPIISAGVRFGGEWPSHPTGLGGFIAMDLLETLNLRDALLANEYYWDIGGLSLTLGVGLVYRSK